MLKDIIVAIIGATVGALIAFIPMIVSNKKSRNNFKFQRV